MIDFPHPRRIEVASHGGETIALSVHEAGAGDGHGESRPTVVLVHGWPELAYSWRNQVGPLVEAGYRVLVPDLRGFGASDNPKPKEKYTIHHMVGDLKGLLDATGVEKAVFVGHDWGGFLVWPMAVLNPDRVAGVIGVCTPHKAPPPVEPLKILEKRFTANHYFIRFQEPGAPEALFTGHEEKFFRMMFRRPAPRAIWEKLIPGIYDIFTVFGRFNDSDDSKLVISREHLQVYVDAYQRSGFHGGVNLYRNVDGNYHLMKDVDHTVRAPAFMISAELDIFLPPETTEGMEEIVPNLDRALIKDCGHWVMWEKPEELNALMIRWLKENWPA
ncbi:MAG: alpha/beta fold hydrolase [Alphaproteobacteria bacterium]|nr:alpha/beta fold hydrolase [Alphaproteobacteria bacterium]